jgi:nucleotide-binding universal stress UspA family protein
VKKILIGVDGSDSSFRAVEYAGEQFSGVSDLQMTLLHVIPYPPAPLWDEGHIPTAQEEKEREQAIEKWVADQHAGAGPVFNKAISILVDKGVARSLLNVKTISDSGDIAESILEETRDGGYMTLIAGRRGFTAMKSMVMGSVTTKLVNHGSGVAVCVVG